MRESVVYNLWLTMLGAIIMELDVKATSRVFGFAYSKGSSARRSHDGRTEPSLQEVHAQSP